MKSAVVGERKTFPDLAGGCGYGAGAILCSCRKKDLNWEKTLDKLLAGGPKSLLVIERVRVMKLFARVVRPGDLELDTRFPYYCRVARRVDHDTSRALLIIMRRAEVPRRAGAGAKILLHYRMA